jgi:MFS family permease
MGTIPGEPIASDAPPPAPDPRRYTVVAVVALAALWMYVDRVCFSILADPIRKDLAIPPDQMDIVLGAFFFAYALCQIPVGALADRFGPRLVLALCVAGWSTAMAGTAFVSGVVGLLAARLLLGVSEAGGYPAASGLVRNWARAEERGRFSSIVTLGGRIGGSVAPWVTAVLAVALAEWAALGGGTQNAGQGNWRGVMFLYGLSGLAVAALLWRVVRDRPGETPAAAASGPPGDADADGPRFVGEARPRVTHVGFGERIGLLARSQNMWASGAMQFALNVGWAFLVTLLPRFLDAEGVPLEERGLMQSVPLAVGCVGMLCGGFVTDGLARRLGVRWGRSVPIAVSLAGGAAAYAAAPWLGGPWAVVAALSAVAFLVDLEQPSVWAFNQDVGGHNVGAAFGWGNMWGNFGAFFSPILLGAVQRQFGWKAVFLTCAAALAAAAAGGLWMNASRPLEEGG